MLKILKHILPILMITVAFGCTQGTKHPQAELINKATPASLTDDQIVQFADSVDANLNSLDKASSLVYVSNGVSVLVDKFSSNGLPVLYTMQRINEGLNTTLDKYYLKNDSLILNRISIRTSKDRYVSNRETRTYFRNNTPFKMDSRISTSDAENAASPFNEVKNFKSKVFPEQMLTMLNDAIAGVNTFEMVFDQYIDTENEKLLVLKSKIPGGYTSSVFIEESDELIDSIKTDPSLFKDEKIVFHWRVVNNEARYVPKTAGTTSANGLNK